VSSPLSDLELACGIVLGFDRRPAPPATVGVTPLEAIERVVLPALRRAPCLVSFSGGRDSSAVLAVATRVARRQGLPDPIPATNRFTGAPATEEAEWQEQVVTHLGLSDWLRREFTDELDAIGPYAQRVLRRHGLLWPFNAHFHLPLLEAASGGSLLTGVGGDELFMAAARPRTYAVLRGLERPRMRDILTVGFGLAPRPVRRAVYAHRTTVPFAWLRPRTRRALARTLADEDAGEPLAPVRRLRQAHTHRALNVATASLEALARDHDVELAHPLAAREVSAAVARAFPRGFEGRTAGMRALFDAVLPDAILARPTKASFDEAFIHRHSHEFVAAWEGDGVPIGSVDPVALAREWRSEAPAPQSLTLLQAAWLAAQQPTNGSGRERVQQAVGGLLE
jgi:asparagine synthetase B (glutamine-hydrolysing)